MKGVKMDGNIILLAAIVFVAYTTQAMSGFGSTILAVTLGVHLYPIDVLLPILVPLDLLVNLYIVIRHHRHISKPLLYRSILPLMGAGLLTGILIFNLTQGTLLKYVFGILVVLLSMQELYRLFRCRNNSIAISDHAAKAWIFSAGIVHGLYASGGPLLIYAVSRLNLAKSVFRSTLSAVWFILSVILTASYLITGKLDLQSLKFIILFLPLILAGIGFGEWLHLRINEYRFRIFVFAVLLFAGIAVCLS
jgi:hypothetical protein